MKWPYYQRHASQISLNHITLKNLAVTIFEIFVRISLNVNFFLNLALLALCETNLDDSIDSGNFSISVYLPLIRKGSITHMYGLPVSVNEGLPLAGKSSLEKCADFYLIFN